MQTAAQFAGQLTGGPECLINLAIALGANLPAGCTSVFTGNRLKTKALRQDYPTFSELGERGVEGQEELLLRRGDMLVLPEVDDCPTRLVERGVRVDIPAWHVASVSAAATGLPLLCAQLLARSAVWRERAAGDGSAPADQPHTPGAGGGGTRCPRGSALTWSSSTDTTYRRTRSRPFKLHALAFALVSASHPAAILAAVSAARSSARFRTATAKSHSGS